MIPKIYIIEGGDGVGKTTLANAIAEHEDCNIVHNTAPEEGPFEKVKENFKQVAEAALQLAVGGSSTVFDRLHMSNMVYGITRHPDEDFLHYERGAVGLEELLSGLPVVRILMRRAWHEARYDLSLRGEAWPALFKEFYLFDEICDDKWKRLELGPNGATNWALAQLDL